MKEIPLTKGYVALIDDEDFERVSAKRWSALEKTNGVYAVHYYRTGRKLNQIRLHRFLLNAPEDLLVDHKNRQPLDCRKENLRLATFTQNRQNSGHCRDSAVPYKGVIKKKSLTNPFAAKLKFKGKQNWLGSFPTAEAAARAYDKAAFAAWGEFAYLNFPEQIKTLVN